MGFDDDDHEESSAQGSVVTFAESMNESVLFNEKKSSSNIARLLQREPANVSELKRPAKSILKTSSSSSSTSTSSIDTQTMLRLSPGLSSQVSKDDVTTDLDENDPDETAQAVGSEDASAAVIGKKKKKKRANRPPKKKKKKPETTTIGQVVEQVILSHSQQSGASADDKPVNPEVKFEELRKDSKIDLVDQEITACLPRNDFYQTEESVCVSVYSKNLDPSLVQVEFLVYKVSFYPCRLTSRYPSTLDLLLFNHLPLI